MKNNTLEDDTRNEYPSIGSNNQYIESFLNNRYDFMFNLVTNRPEFRGLSENESLPIPVNDVLLNSLIRELNYQRIDCSKDRLRSLLKSDFCKIYDPFKMYLDNLPKWEGDTDYIQQLCDTIKTTNKSFWEKALKRWLIAMVASLLNDDIVNQQMLVLSGPQGIGKTTWSSKLVPEKLKKYKYSGVVNPNDKDTARLVAECMLIDIDELESLQRREVGDLKQLITKPQIKVRIQYDTYFTDMPHRASFIGSVNHKEFLTDMSGTRRFLCFDVGKIDYTHSINMDHVFAQAFALYKQSEKYWFDNEEIDEINKINQEFETVCPEEELLLKYYKPSSIDDANYMWTVSEIVSNINANNFNAVKLLPTKMSEALRKNGFTLGRNDKGSRAWAVKSNKFDREE